MLNKKVKFLVMDVDGTLTDGKINMSEIMSNQNNSEKTAI